MYFVSVYAHLIYILAYGVALKLIQYDTIQINSVLSWNEI